MPIRRESFGDDAAAHAVELRSVLRIESLSMALRALNLGLLLLTATQAGSMSREVVPAIPRAHALELVDEGGVVRSRLEVKPGGEVLL